MTNKTPDPTSDTARTGKDSDENRAELEKTAKEGLEKATRELRTGDARKPGAN